jgi:hypothetical protein
VRFIESAAFFCPVVNRSHFLLPPSVSSLFRLGAVKQLHIILLVISLACMALFLLLLYRPYAKRLHRDSKAVAGLLSQLPSEVDVEGHVKTVVLGIVKTNDGSRSMIDLNANLGGAQSFGGAAAAASAGGCMQGGMPAGMMMNMMPGGPQAAQFVQYNGAMGMPGAPSGVGGGRGSGGSWFGRGRAAAAAVAADAVGYGAAYGANYGMMQ